MTRMGTDVVPNLIPAPIAWRTSVPICEIRGLNKFPPEIRNFRGVQELRIVALRIERIDTDQP
jgi:hypothetical protein